MSIFSKMFRSRDKPTDSTNGSGYRYYFGGTTSGKTVNERSAMQISAVYACVRVLSEAIASLPLHFYEYTEEGSKEKAIDHPLYLLLHDEPNPEMTSFIFRETMMTHLLLWGNAYAQVIRNGRGEVVALYPLMANRMRVDRDENGHLYYEYQMNTSDAPTMKTGTVRLTPADVLHIPGLGFDGLVGYSPIAMAKNSIGMAMATEEYGATFFKNGANPSGILSMPGTVKDPETRSGPPGSRASQEAITQTR
jgi:HK97 family phage portal protein